MKYYYSSDETNRTARINALQKRKGLLKVRLNHYHCFGERMVIATEETLEGIKASIQNEIQEIDSKLFLLGH